LYNYWAAEKVGLPTSPPYLSLLSKSNKSNASFLTGVSFASGGAGIFDGTDERYVSESILLLLLSVVLIIGFLKKKIVLIGMFSKCVYAILEYFIK
jgi:hypothetical protein